MLKRLEGENAHIRDLLSTGEVTSDGAEFPVQQLTHSRNQLIVELASLEVGDPHESASPSPMSIVAETRGSRRLMMVDVTISSGYGREPHLTPTERQTHGITSE
jgi:hypothetical protein